MTSQFTQLRAWIQQGLQRFHWVIRMLWQHFPFYFMCLIWLVQVPFPPPLVYGSLERNKQLAEKRDGRKGGTLWSPAEMLDQVFVLFSFLRWIRVHKSWCSVFCSLKLMWKCSTLGLRNTVSQSVCCSNLGLPWPCSFYEKCPAKLTTSLVLPVEWWNHFWMEVLFVVLLASSDIFLHATGQQLGKRPSLF